MNEVDGITTEDLEGLPVLSKMARRDLRAAAAVLGPSAVRHMVEVYYDMQGVRMRSNHRLNKQHDELNLPASVEEWIRLQMGTTEQTIRALMEEYALQQREGRWAMSVYGIGPVLTAGLLGHIDITRAPTVGHIWRFAGLDPTVTWDRGAKRPWNARLKTLCWKIGDSFVKFHNQEACFYGLIYSRRKQYELERDERGGHREAAEATLAVKKFKDREVQELYESGHLPAGRIDLRARRYAVKLFLAHLHHVMYETYYGEPPPKPYVISQLGHADYIAPPGWPCD